MKRTLAYALPALFAMIIALCVPGALHWLWRI